MYCSIRHVTRFRYSRPVTESIMEVRTRPRTDGNQRCLSFELVVQPRTTIFSSRDSLGNWIHYFDIPGAHQQLTITSQALVEIRPAPELPARLGESDSSSAIEQAWAAIDATVGHEEVEMLLPSHFARSCPGLETLAGELGLSRNEDPLALLHRANRAIFEAFDYVPSSTRVDSPIDQALENRHGVCQDFAHILIALLRPLGIASRYVSGYLLHTATDHSTEGATHAWVETLLPGLGWVGWDPTNNTAASERHIRVALGRDYADVPPTRGVFKGEAESELAVGVRVSPSEAPPPEEELRPEAVEEPPHPAAVPEDAQQQQQQQ